MMKKKIKHKIYVHYHFEATACSCFNLKSLQTFDTCFYGGSHRHNEIIQYMFNMHDYET